MSPTPGSVGPPRRLELTSPLTASRRPPSSPLMPPRPPSQMEVVVKTSSATAEEKAASPSLPPEYASNTRVSVVMRASAPMLAMVLGLAGL